MLDRLKLIAEGFRRSADNKESSYIIYSGHNIDENAMTTLTGMAPAFFELENLKVQRLIAQACQNLIQALANDAELLTAEQSKLLERVINITGAQNLLNDEKKKQSIQKTLNEKIEKITQPDRQDSARAMAKYIIHVKFPKQLQTKPGPLTIARFVIDEGTLIAVIEKAPNQSAEDIRLNNENIAQYISIIKKFLSDYPHMQGSLKTLEEASSFMRTASGIRHDNASIAIGALAQEIKDAGYNLDDKRADGVINSEPAEP